MTEQEKILFFLLLAFVFCHDKVFGEVSDNKTTCERRKAKFASVTTSFIDCSIANAEPISYCQKCGNGYSEVIIKYNDLLNAKIIVNQTDYEYCKDKYFDQDRLNLIESILLSTTALWEAGSCSNCYDWIDGSAAQNLSDSTKLFFNNLKDFKNCTNPKESEPCSKCLSAYSILNDQYNEIKKDSNDKICFDIKDAMNKTRLHWSRDLNCCKDRKSSLTAFIVASTIIGGLIPFMFYSGFMFFGWRRQQHEFLIDSEPQTSSIAPPAESISGVQIEEDQSTSLMYATIESSNQPPLLTL